MNLIKLNIQLFAYDKQTWANDESGGTPINATSLNHIEEGIYNNSTEIANNSTNIDNNLSKINNIYVALGLNTDTYDSTDTYAIDDLVIYNNIMYCCNTDDTTGDWDSPKWDIVPLFEESEE